EVGKVVAKTWFLDEIDLVHRERSRNGLLMIAPALGEPASLMPGSFEQVGPDPPGLLQRGLSTPTRDRRVVARDQHVRDGHPPELPGPRVVRVIEQAAFERLVRERLLASHHAGHEP